MFIFHIQIIENTFIIIIKLLLLIGRSTRILRDSNQTKCSNKSTANVYIEVTLQ